MSADQSKATARPETADEREIARLTAVVADYRGIAFEQKEWIAQFKANEQIASIALGEAARQHAALLVERDALRAELAEAKAVAEQRSADRDRYCEQRDEAREALERAATYMESYDRSAPSAIRASAINAARHALARGGRHECRV